MSPTNRTSGTGAILRASLVALLALAATGCYTLFQHPGVARMNYRRPDPGQPCTSCHSDDEIRNALRHRNDPHSDGAWLRLSEPWWSTPSDSTRSHDGAED